MQRKDPLPNQKLREDEDRSPDELRTAGARQIHLLEEQHHGAPEPGYQQMEYQLPQSYGSTRIMAMVRDPRWVFVYWEITQECAGKLRSRMGAEAFDSGKTVLRVYDLTEDRAGGTYKDIPVETDTNNWYIEVEDAGHTYRVAIGRKYGEQFHAFAESYAVSTPPGDVSDIVDGEWLTVHQLYDACTVCGPGESSPAVLGIARRLEQEIGSPAVMHIGSPLGKVEEERKGIWLQINTDLILYGKASPGVSVTVQGRSVTLREDGSFSVRYTLADGKLVLPVTARDNGQEVTITPDILKITY